jgi:hypothetical protein
MGQSNSHKKMRSVPEYSLVSTTQADKKPQCPTAGVCITALWPCSQQSFKATNSVDMGRSPHTNDHSSSAEFHSFATNCR